MWIQILSLVLLSVALALPPEKILRQEFDINPDGTHNYLYETENGIYADQQGYPKAENIHAAQGQFQYLAPDGQIIR